jgi:hypothetical protein
MGTVAGIVAAYLGRYEATTALVLSALAARTLVLT